MSDTLSVYTNVPWTDSYQGLIWTVSDGWNTFVQLVIGFLFGLAQPCLERIVGRFLSWVNYSMDKWQQKTDRSNESDESTPLTGRRSRRQYCSSGFCNQSCITDTFAKISSLLLVVVAIAYATAGTFVTKLPTGEAALSASKMCGLWSLRDSSLAAAQDEDALVQGQKETRAGKYARDCYGLFSPTSLGQCSIFRNSYVPTLETNRNQQCPFVNESYCTGNGFTAAKFTTGSIQATTIGINEKEIPYFNRTMICVPLNINQGFVEKDGGEPGQWAYKLGPVSSDEYASQYTFRQYGDPFTFDVRSYTMSTYTHFYSKAGDQNYWTPIPELKIRSELNQQSDAYSLTLMFINSCRLFYKEPSNDPIFPADHRWPSNPDLWINNDSRARPLVCIDWIEACTNNGGCMPAHKYRSEEAKSYTFTRYALNKSTAFHAIEFRGATGLDAQDKIKDDTSLPLSSDPPQWFIESWALFNTSLSRIQYDALDIANGTGWDKAPRYEQRMPASGQQAFCYLFTFQLPNGYDNIRIWPTIGILAIPIFLYLGGLETDEEIGEEKKNSWHFAGSKLLGVEWGCWKLLSLFQNRKSRSIEELDGNVTSQD